MSVFVFAFIGSFLFYLFSQKDVYADWRRRIFLFPVFMAGSMGFAVNNSRAVLEGLFKKKSEFVRTPKYSIKDKKDSWTDKKYVPVKISSTVVMEIDPCGVLPVRRRLVALFPRDRSRAVPAPVLPRLHLCVGDVAAARLGGASSLCEITITNGNGPYDRH